MIEESELAKSIRQGGRLKGSAEIVSRTHVLLSQMESSVNGSRLSSVISSGASSPTAARPAGQDLVQQAQTMIDEITEKVQTTTDTVLLEDLLGLCDKLHGGIARLSSIPSSKSLLRGLGITVASGTTSSAVLHESPTDEESLTPRVDKGKGRAEPEPEEPEKVLSPTFRITESEEEDEDDNRFAVSSMNLASSWTSAHLRLPLHKQKNLSGLHHARISPAVVRQMERRETHSLQFRPPTQCLLREAPLHPHHRPRGHSLEPYQQALPPSLEKSFMFFVPTNYSISY